jgi:hypothetical protein
LARILLLFIVILGPCACSPRAPGEADGTKAVQIELEEVTARQYRNGTLRFSFQAWTLKLDEQAQVLEASRNVTGRLEAGMWSRRNK